MDDKLKDSILKLIGDRPDECQVALIGDSHIAVILEVPPETKAQILMVHADDIMKKTELKDTHEYKLTAPLRDESIIIPSRQRKPWSKRYKGQDRVRSNKRPPRK